MALTINDECIACGACELVCPNDAISEGDPIYTIDPTKCQECGDESPHCAEECSVDACVSA